MKFKIVESREEFKQLDKIPIEFENYFKGLGTPFSIEKVTGKVETKEVPYIEYNLTFDDSKINMDFDMNILGKLSESPRYEVIYDPDENSPDTNITIREYEI